jgi:hypothetical protein
MAVGDDHEENTSADPDRRALLRMGVAAGAIVWSAPLITSTVASAVDGTCTPKCLPNLTGISGPNTNGNLVFGLPLRCRYNIVLTPAITCPCGGTPTNPTWTWSSPTGSNPTPGQNPVLTLVSTNGATNPTLRYTFDVAWFTTITFTGSVEHRCLDRAGDTCARTRNWTVVLTRTVGPSGNCPEILASNIVVTLT